MYQYTDVQMRGTVSVRLNFIHNILNSIRITVLSLLHSHMGTLTNFPLHGNNRR